MIQNLRYVMGTILTVRVTGSEAHEEKRARDALLETVQRLEERLSIYRPTSEISQINQAAGQSPVLVSAETYSAIEQSLRFANLTAGAFDPTVRSAPWDYHDVVLDPHNRTVFLPHPEMSLNLGGIGKGFALDQALDRVKREPGVEQIRMNFGGQLLFWNREGFFPEEPVAIEDPDQPGSFLDTFSVGLNCSISTSSHGERPGHLIDPRTGRPAHGYASVTVIAPTATEAEALSTALFALGPQDAPAFMTSYPAIGNGVKAFLFLSNSGRASCDETRRRLVA